jgi:ribonucleoside-diphosphate reductase alpha chain
MSRENFLDIQIDRSRDSLFDELGLKRLRESYMTPEETSPQERFAFVSKTFGSNSEHAQRLYEYASKHWLSYSTPILSFGRSKRGLPISCFLNYIEDTAEGLVENLQLAILLSGQVVLGPFVHY